jgi:hypothetical protein
MSNTTLLLEALPLRQRLIYSLIDLYRRESEEIPKKKHDRLLHFYISCCKELLDSSSISDKIDHQENDYHKVLLDDSNSEDEILNNLSNENDQYSDNMYNTYTNSDKSEDFEEDVVNENVNSHFTDFVDLDISKLGESYNGPIGEIIK